MMATSPVASSQRIILLDALRGFALLGIMFVNMTWFTGIAVMSPDQRSASATAGLDEIIYWLIHVLVDGKFWTLFAILFGLGVAMQQRRAAESHRPAVTANPKFSQLYIRRLIVLLLIGLAHAILMWFGDIVSLYALAGFILLIFINRSDRAVLIGSGLLLLAPVVQMFIWLTIYNTHSVAPSPDPGHGPVELLVYFGSGSYWQVFWANWAFLKERWLIAIFDGRLLKLGGLFLLGMWMGRRQILTRGNLQARLLWPAMVIGLSLGIIGNAIVHSQFSDVSLRPPSITGWWVETIKSVSIPALSIGYIAALALLNHTLRAGWLTRMMATVGRMSLTNYILQSALGMAIFYGYGWGWWGQFSVTNSILPIACIYCGQFVFSWLWLQHFRYGPLEWIWRCATYWRVLPIRKPLAPAKIPAQIQKT